MALSRWRRRLGTTVPSAGAFVLEVVSVVLAVLLALAADDWRQSRQRGAEVESTAVRAPGRVPSEAQLDSLDRELYARGYFQPAGLTDAAWEATLGTGTRAHLDFGLAMLLGGVYEAQASCRATVDRLLTTMSLSHYMQPPAPVAMRGRYEGLNTLWWREKYLLEDYDRALERLGVEPAGGTGR